MKLKKGIIILLVIFLFVMLFLSYLNEKSNYAESIFKLEKELALKDKEILDYEMEVSAAHYQNNDLINELESKKSKNDLLENELISAEQVIDELSDVIALLEQELEVILLKESKRVIENKAEMLIGSWHKEPLVASDYFDKYHFFSDNSFVFENSNEESRLLFFSGEWSLLGNELNLQIKKKVVIEGGSFEKAGIVPGYWITGGKRVQIEVSPYEHIIYPLSEITETFDMPPHMKIGNVDFWRLQIDPDIYLENYNY